MRVGADGSANVPGRCAGQLDFRQPEIAERRADQPDVWSQVEQKRRAPDALKLKNRRNLIN